MDLWVPSNIWGINSTLSDGALVPLTKITTPVIISHALMMTLVAIFLGLRVWTQYERKSLFALYNIFLYLAGAFFYTYMILELWQILVGYATVGTPWQTESPNTKTMITAAKVRLVQSSCRIRSKPPYFLPHQTR